MEWYARPVDEVKWSMKSPGCKNRVAHSFFLKTRLVAATKRRLPQNFIISLTPSFCKMNFNVVLSGLIPSGFLSLIL
jgi:hypothetical protein